MHIREYRCGEPNCYRNFSNVAAFRKHIYKHFSTSRTHVTCCTTSDTVSNVNSYDAMPCTSTLVTASYENTPLSPSLDTIDLGQEFSNTITSFISEMYNNSLVPRNFVNFVITQINTIFCKGPIENLAEVVRDQLFQLQASEESVQKIDNAFQIITNCLSPFKTEHRCLKYFRNCGKYITPVTFTIGTQYVWRKTKTGSVSFGPKTVTGTLVPLIQIFTILFQKKGVLSATINYINRLNSVKSYENFIQGRLWRNILQSMCPQEGEIILPLFLYFDDYTLGNALGSRASKTKLGALYLSIPCLPPHLFTALDSIFLFALFNSNDRTTFGNTAVFTPIIQELQKLQDNAIAIENGSNVVRLRFRLALIVGDNLGLHSILGFNESFSSNYCCRFCKIHKKDLKTAVVLDPILKRTKESYESDVQLANPALTGIKESCIWHRLSDYHVTNNYAVDVMHDLLEGVCVFDITALLRSLIVNYKLFSLETLNNRIASFHYGHSDSLNTPQPLSMEQLHSKIKMSASEMLCFVRHLGLLIGDFVPETLDVWHIWINLREIIDTVCSPSLLFCENKRLAFLIREYLDLVVFHFKALKPKHHFLLHYSDVFDYSGPLVHFWSMKFEQFHRRSKLTSNVSGSFNNMPHTLAHKSQMKFCFQMTSPLKNCCQYTQGVPIANADYITYFPTTSRNSLLEVKKVVSDGTSYKVGQVVVIDAKNFATFAIIKKIFIYNNDNVYFLCTKLNTLYFDRHCYAYEVEACTQEYVIEQEALHTRLPGLLTKKKGKMYVSLQEIL